MRVALGATKVRLARLALAESILLAIAAGGLGLSLAWGLLKIFLRLAPSNIPKIDQATLDLRVFAAAAGLSLAWWRGPLGYGPRYSACGREGPRGDRTSRLV